MESGATRHLRQLKHPEIETQSDQTSLNRRAPNDMRVYTLDRVPQIVYAREQHMQIWRRSAVLARHTDGPRTTFTVKGSHVKMTEH